MTRSSGSSPRSRARSSSACSCGSARTPPSPTRGAPPALRPHQVEGIAWLDRVGRGLLADTPRSGKTAQLLRAAEEPVLVVAPAHLRDTWLNQRDLWRPDLDMTVVSYGGIARRVAGTPDGSGPKRKNVPVPREEYAREWGTVICDEAHMLVNAKANWTKAVTKLRSERLYLATGTPIPHWAHELLVPLRLLYPGDRRFTNKQRWVDEWFASWQPAWGGTQIIPPVRDGNGPREDITWEQFWLGNGLDGEHGRMLQREVDLGVPFTEQTIEVEMTPQQRRFYDALVADYVAWTESGIEVSAWSDGGLHTKLAQAATALELFDTDVKGSGSGKFDVLHELLKESPRSPTLAFCHFRSTAEAITTMAQRLRLRVGMIHGGVPVSARTPIEHAFQRGDLDVLVGTLGTVSTGLDLAHATTEIFVEHSWTPWKNEQALKRAMKWGKIAHVHVAHLWTADSVDTGMREVVAAKTDQQVRALSAREFRRVLSGSEALTGSQA